jgi:hypothetical protein
MNERTRPASASGSLLREPTLHFLVLALFLFAARGAFGAGGGNVVEVDRGEVLARVRELEAESGAALSAEERQRVEDGYVEERILVREALALGLLEDPRIDDVLVQKMLHVLSADVIQPSDEELRAYYDAHRERYAPPPSLDMDELVIAAPDALPAPLERRLRAGAPAAELAGEPGVRHNPMVGVGVATLAGAFGAETAARIAAAQVGEWVGPHHTVRGQHWFRVSARPAAAPAPLEVVREQVRLDWITESEQARLDARVRELRERYSVVYVEAGEGP